MPWNDRPSVSALARTRRNAIRITAATVAIVATTGTILLAQPQPGSEEKGKARVVERKGPEVDVRANAAGQVVVLFPQNSSDNKNVVEVTMVESQMPAPAGEGQPQGPQTATPTGKEYVFSSKDARDQTVSFKLDSNGNARKLMLLAKLDGKTVEVRQAGGPEGVAIYTIAMPEAPKPQEQPKAEGEQQQQPAAPAGPAAPPAQAAVIVFYSGAIAA